MPFSHDPRAANKLHWPTFCFCFCPVGKNSVRSSEIVEKVWEEQKMSRSHVFEWCKRLVQKTGARVKWREWCKSGAKAAEVQNQGHADLICLYFSMLGASSVTEYLPQGQTINQHVCIDIMWDLLRSVRVKRQKMWDLPTSL